MFFAGALALTAGCGSDALTVQGTVDLSWQNPGDPTPTTPRFDFAAHPITLEAGSGVTGSCARVNNRWEVRIARESPGAMDFKSFSLSIPVPTAGSTSESPNASFVVGDSTFTGSGTCTDTSTTVSDGLHVVTHCTGLRATGDSRVVAADVNLVFTNCSPD